MPVSPSDSLSPGDTVRGYQVLALIGTGAVGAVYRVRHERLGREFALKMLLSASTEDRARLLAEGEALASLRHPNVLGMHEILRLEDGAPALVLDLVQGPSLEQLLQTARPSVPDALTLLRGVLSGVAAAHAQGIIHCDLCPANVLLDIRTSPPTPLVADFGVARDLRRPTKTVEGRFVGTFAYAAPEQLDGRQPIRPTADVYALGLLAYLLLTGRHAFPQADPVSVVNAMRVGRYEPLPDDLPAGARAMVERALRPRPQERPQDASAMLALLDDAPQHSPAGRQGIGRRAVGTGLLAAVAVGCAVGLAWQSWQDRRLADALRGAEHRVLAERLSATRPGHALAHARAAAALEGRKSLDSRAVADWARRGALSRHLPVESGNLTEIGLAGGRVVGAHEDGEVFVWDAASGEELGRFDSHIFRPTELHVSADGERVVIGADSHVGEAYTRVVVRRLPDGEPVGSVTGALRYVRAVRDQDALCAVVDAPDRLRLVVMSTVDGRLLQSIPVAPAQRQPVSLAGLTAGCTEGGLYYQDGEGVVVDRVDGRPTFTVPLTPGARLYPSRSGAFQLADHTVSFWDEDGQRALLGTSSANGIARVFSSLDQLLVRQDRWADLFDARDGTRTPLGEAASWGEAGLGGIVVGFRDGVVRRVSGVAYPALRGLPDRVLALDGDGGGSVVAASLSGGAVLWPDIATRLGERDRQHVPGAQWSAGGAEVLWSQGPAVWRTSDGDSEQLAELDEPVVSQWASPDGSLAVLGERKVYRVDADGVTPLGAYGRIVDAAYPMGEHVVLAHLSGIERRGPDEEVSRALDQREAALLSANGANVWFGYGDGNEVAVARYEPSTDTFTPLAHALPKGIGVASMREGVDGELLVGTWSGHVLRWAAGASVAEPALGPIGGPARALASHEGGILAAGWAGDVVRFESGGPVWRRTIGASVVGVAPSPDGARIAVTDQDGLLTLLDATGEVRSVRRAHSGPADVRWTEDEGLVTLGEDDWRIRWDAARLEEDIASLAATGGLTNLRVCAESGVVVPVVPYPEPTTVWAPDALCERAAPASG